MKTAKINSFRRLLGGLLSSLIVLFFAQNLNAQDVTEATAVVQQANAVPIAQAGAPTAPSTRATLVARHENWWKSSLLIRSWLGPTHSTPRPGRVC
jgi:hypothetical protein